MSTRASLIPCDLFSVLDVPSDSSDDEVEYLGETASKYDKGGDGDDGDDDIRYLGQRQQSGSSSNAVPDPPPRSFAISDPVRKSAQRRMAKPGTILKRLKEKHPDQRFARTFGFGRSPAATVDAGLNAFNHRTDPSTRVRAERSQNHG